MTTSNSDRTIQIGVEVDSTQAAQGLTQIRQAAQNTAQSVTRAGQQAGAGLNQIGAAAQRTATEVEQAAQRAGDGLARIGDGAPVAEQRITRSAQSIINSIERTTAALRAGGAQSAEYYQTLANERGIDPAVLDPYIQRLRQAEAAQRAASQSMQHMGMSARATAAAMRTVPAQFTDIVTSLQAGQAPLTVLLQQGGQLRDQFGGIGAAANALGGYILGLINPYTVAASAALALAVAYEKGAGEARAFERELITSGGQAGVTTQQLIGMAESVDKVAGTQARAAEVLTLLAASGDVGSASFERFTIAAIAFEQAGGQAAEETVKAFQELGKEPLKAALKLNEAQGFLTATVYEQIKALEGQGRTTEAAKVAQEAYAAALEERTPAMARQLGTIERGWLAIKNATKEVLDNLLDIGRVETTAQKIANLQKQQADANRRASGGGFGETGGGAATGSPMSARQVDAARAEAEAIGEQIRLLKLQNAQQEQNAQQKKEQLRLVGELAEWDKRGAGFAEKKDKRDKEMIAEAVKGRELINAGLLTEEQLKTRLLAITEKYKEAEKKGPKTKQGDEFAADRANAKAWAQEFEKLSKASIKAEADMLGLTKVQAKLLEFLKSPEYANGSEEMRQLALQAAYAGIAFEQEEAAMDAAANAQKELTKEHENYIKELSKGAAQAQDRLDKLAAENEAAGIAAAANISLAEAVEQVAIARLQELQAVEMSFGNEDAVKAIQAEIDARRELQKEIRTKDARKAQDDATKDAKKEADKSVKEWEKAAEKIENTLTDALMRGFESGKGFAETLRDTVVNMFKTMVLRPIVSAIVSPIASGVQSMIGGVMGGGALGGMASSAGGSALGGMAGNVLGALGTGLGSGFGMIAGGGIGGWLTASTSLIGTGTAAGAMAGLGALAGPISAVLGIGSLLKSLDDSGTMHTGGLGSYSKAGGVAVGDAVKGQSSGFFNLASTDYKSSTEQASVKIAQSIVGILDSTADTFGKDAGYYAATAFADDTSKDGAWGGLTVKLADKIVADWGSGGDGFLGKVFADGEKGAKEYAAAVGKDVRDYLLTQTPQWADDMLMALGDAPSLENLEATIKEVNALQKSLEAVGLGSLFEDITTEAKNGSRVLRSDLIPWMQKLANQGGPTADTLKAIANYPNELLTLAGTSRDNLVKIYTDGFISGDVAGAGQAVADTLVASIEQTVIGSAASQIFDIANRGIITPIIDAMLNGQTLSQALSDGAIEATITKIKAQATALATVMNDPRIKELMDGLRSSLGGALGSGSTAGVTPRYQRQPTAAADSMTKAAEEAEKAAEEARKKWQDITDTLLSDQDALLIEKLRAQGREADALAMEFEIATKGMDAYQIGLARQNQQTRQQIDLLNKTNAQRDEYAAMEVELLRAQGLEVEAVAAQRRIDIKGMADTEIELYDLNAARKAEIDSIAANKEALDAFWTAADSTAEQYLSTDLLKSFRLDRLAQQINTATGGSSITGAMLSALGVDDIKNAVAQFVSSDASLTAKTQILELGASLLSLGDAARQEAEGLRARIAAATDTPEQAIARQRAALQDDQNRALFDQAIAAERAKAASEQRLGLESQLLQLLGNTAALRERELAALDPSNRALQERIYAINDANAAIDAAYSALERAVNAQKSTADKARQAAASLVGEVKTVFDLLKNSVRDLYGEVDQTRAMQSREGHAFIDAALAAARATGVLPDDQELSDAISAVRRGFEGRDANDRDAAFERLVAAGKLDELQAITGRQLTAAERQLKAAEETVDALDATLRQQREQIDALRGIDNSVGSVEDAIRALGQAIAAQASAAAGSVGRGFDSGVVSAAAKKPSVGGSAASSASGGRLVGGGERTMDEIITEDWMRNRGLDTTPEGIAKFKSELTFGRRADANGLEFVTITDRSGNVYGNLDLQTADETWIEQQRRALQWAEDAGLPDAYSQVFAPRDDLIGEARAILEGQGAQGLYDAIKNTGASLSEAEALLGLPAGALEEEVEKLGLPKFDVGTNYVPRDTLAIVHEGEAIIPKPYNPAAGGMSMDSVVRELRELRELTAGLLHQQRRTADAVNGFGEQPMGVETV